MEPKFDFSHFMNRKLWKQKDAASIIGVSGGLVGMWASNKAVPSYEKIVKLIDNGISAEELFGKECADRLLQNSVGLPLQLPPEIANDPDFQKGLQQSIDAKVSAAVKAELAALKSKGLL